MKKYFSFLFTAVVLFTTISCSYQPLICNVSYDTQDSGKQFPAISVSYGSKLTDAQLPNLSADGKLFGGWYKESGCTTKWNKDTDTVTKDITLYAKWQNASPLIPLVPSTEVFTVTFNTRGLSAAPSDIKVANGETISNMPANPTHFTWDFEGWYKDKKNTQMWDTASDKVTKNITLYAKWKPKSIGETDLWKSKTDRPDDYYRIPAFAETKDGTLLAVTDLRYKHAADVGKYTDSGSPSGFGKKIHRIDLILKRSLDYGKSWSSTGTNLTNVPETPEYGCGDAAIVADRDSDEVLIIHVKGNVRYQDGKQNVAMLKSSDGGNSFTPTDITAQIYGMNASGSVCLLRQGKYTSLVSLKSISTTAYTRRL